MKRKLVYFPVEANTRQVLVLPNGSEILDIHIRERIPQLLVLMGEGTSVMEITVGLYISGYNVEGSILNYLGTITLNNGHGPTFHCLIHKS